jgi:hypothetical protein
MNFVGTVLCHNLWRTICVFSNLHLEYVRSGGVVLFNEGKIMIKTLRTISSLVVVALLVIIVAPQIALAQEASDTRADHETAGQQAMDDYTYDTPQGGSLSLLCRRSLQLFDEANEDVSLSKAQTIYAETNIVQEMGPRLLDVNERVVVPFRLVDRYATSSQDLSARLIALWERYARSARFELSSVKTTTQVRAEREAANEKKDAANETSEADNEASETANDTSAQTNADSNNRLWWALLIGAALYAAWTVSNRRRQTADE